jgi:hypothetical protein
LGAVELLDDAEPHGLRIIHLIRLANSRAEAGSTGAARDRYRQAERIAVDIGDLTRQLLVLNNLAYTEHEAGNVDTACGETRRSRPCRRPGRPAGIDLIRPRCVVCSASARRVLRRRCSDCSSDSREAGGATVEATRRAPG